MTTERSIGPTLGWSIDEGKHGVDRSELELLLDTIRLGVESSPLGLVLVTGNDWGRGFEAPKRPSH